MPWHLERHRECNTVPRKSSTELIYEIAANPRNMIYYLSETFLLFLFFFLMLDEVSIILFSWSNYDSQLSDIILLDLFFSPIIIIDRKKKKIWKLVN